MIILDTHIWIWWINQTPKRLQMETVKLIEQAEMVVICQIEHYQGEFCNACRICC